MLTKQQYTFECTQRCILFVYMYVGKYRSSYKSKQQNYQTLYLIKNKNLSIHEYLSMVIYMYLLNRFKQIGIHIYYSKCGHCFVIIEKKWVCNSSDRLQLSTTTERQSSKFWESH